MKWEDSYTSKGFEDALARYDESPLVDYNGKVGEIEGYDLYISDLRRTYDTALQLFSNIGSAEIVDLDIPSLLSSRKGGDIAPAATESSENSEKKIIYRTPLLREVPKRSYKDYSGLKNRSYITSRSRIQWYFNNPRQPEVKRQTTERANLLVDYLESRGRDSVLISHEFYLYTLTSVLDKRGFVIERSSTGRIKNWERIRATKRTLHCGVCGHNCLLTNPGCNVGRDAAKQQGIVLK